MLSRQALALRARGETGRRHHAAALGAAWSSSPEDVLRRPPRGGMRRFTGSPHPVVSRGARFACTWNTPFDNSGEPASVVIDLEEHWNLTTRRFDQDLAFAATKQNKLKVYLGDSRAQAIKEIADVVRGDPTKVGRPSSSSSIA